MAQTDARPSLTVILIDDDPEHVALLQRSISRGAMQLPGGDGIEVVGFEDVSVALENVPGEGHVVFLCDYQMPSGTGLEWLPYLLDSGAGPVIVMTSSGSEEIASRAFEMGASKYIAKGRAIREPEYVVGAIRDASRQFLIERRNRDLLKKLKTANHALELKATKLHAMTNTAHAFVADVAHDFRTPLATIKEFAGIVADGIPGPVNEQQVEYLRYVESAVLDLSHMVDDFLDSAKMRAGILRVNRQRHNAGELLDTVRRAVVRRAGAKKITIEESIEEGTPAFFADLEKAGRVLTNLVINAVKFSHEESTVRIQIGTDDDGAIRVAVRDEGRGIAPEDMATIFARFEQVDTGQTERIKGFGLGLSICSQLALINLGRLDVESEYGVGSTFSFSLPPAEPEALVRHYAALLVRMDVGRRLVGLRITAGGPDADPESLHAFLTSTCYPLDLVLESGEEGVCVLGVSSDPDLWMARIRALAQDTRPPMNFKSERVGTWELPAEAERVLDTVIRKAAVHHGG